MRLSLRRTQNGAGIGIFEAGSHRLVSIPRCPVHHPNINRLVKKMLAVDQEIPLSLYDEASHTGLLRALQVAVEPASGLLQVLLLVRDPLEPKHQIKELLKELIAALVEAPWLHSLWLGALPDRTNSLMAQGLEPLFGPAHYCEQSGGVSNFYPPGAFGQANPALHQRAVKEIHRYVWEDAPLAEYYCGVGTIGLGLLHPGRRATFNELGDGSLQGLRLGLKNLVVAQNNVTVLAGPAGDHAEAYDAEGIVIVDPPRKGLDDALMDRLLEDPPRRLIYLSCGIEALIRESAEIQSKGLLSLTHLSAFNYFPFTQHVETLAVFDRNDHSV